MITVNLFTSGRHTKPLIDALKRVKNIQLVGVYKKLPKKPIKADVFIVADFGQIIPKKILELPKYGTLCVHPSLLPKYRGPSPVQQAIIDGEKESGMTIFQMDEKVDHGPIIAQFKEKISNNDTAATLYERLFSAGAKVLVTILPAWIEGQIESREQNHSQATFTKKLSKKDGKINWQWPPEKIERFIRGMTPWPEAWSFVIPEKSTSEASAMSSAESVKSADTSEVKNEKPILKLKILKAHLDDKKLIIDLVQLPGKNPISWKQFQAGHQDWQLI